MKRNSYSFYIEEQQKKWLQDMAEINDRPESYFVRLALDKLIEMTGGY